MRSLSFASRLPLLLIVGSIVAGCGGSDPVGPTDPDELTYHPSLGVDLSQMTMRSSGLYYQVLEEGTGDLVVEEGDALSVAYTGWRHNGTRFDGGVYDFTLAGSGQFDQVIDGWFEGVQGMRVGETRLLVVPYWMGYGDQRVGSIPRYSTLVFRLTLESLEKGD